MILFLALLFVATAIAGFCALLIFWPLALVHLRDHHPDVGAKLGENAFARPSALWWLLAGDYRSIPDTSLSGLATPARISLCVIIFGVAMAGLLALWAGAFA